MRLDKFLTECGVCSRREAARCARSGRVLVNGEVCRDGARHIDPEKDRVVFAGKELCYRRFVYVMLNKPAGLVSATDDARETTVLSLLPEDLRRRELFPCGRLDKDTTGLLILTDDGASAHRRLSPRHHAEKTDRFRTLPPLSAADLPVLEAGVLLDDGYRTLPCRVTADGEDGRGTITLTEGKYHQIKRMMEAVGTRIVELERVSFAGIRLDPALAPGFWRYLSPEEEALFTGEAGPDGP